MTIQTASLRNAARELVIEQVSTAAHKDHELNFEKLHIYRDGSIAWTEHINKSDDLIDSAADHFAAIPSVACVGTGSYRCTCDYCEAVYNKDVEDHRVERELGSDEEDWDKDEEAKIRADYKATAYETDSDAIDDAVSNSDLDDTQAAMLEEFDSIPAGYFDDED